MIFLKHSSSRYYTKFNADALKRAGMGNLSESVWMGYLAETGMLDFKVRKYEKVCD